MKSYKQRVVRIPVGVHKLPKVDFQQDISVRNNAASQISYQSYLIVDSQSNRLRNTESGIPYYLIIIVSCHLAKGLLAYLLCHIVEISVCKFGMIGGDGYMAVYQPLLVLVFQDGFNNGWVLWS